MIVKVKHIHREKILKLKQELFSRWICTSEDLKDIIICSILVRNARILLLGPPETGKSSLVRTIANAFYSKNNDDTIFAVVTGAPEKTLQKVLISTDIKNLLTKGEEKLIIRPIVRARIKFINEINRFSKAVQDALLSLLEEQKLVEYGGIVIYSPDYICFADANPYAGEIELALRSRFMVSIPTTYLRLAESYKFLEFVIEEGTYDISKTMPKIISIEELEEIWDDVERVKIPETVRIFLLLLIETFRCSKLNFYYENKQSMCADCEYAGEPCSKITIPPGERAIIFSMLFARARAWLKGRKEVTYEDVIKVLPYVLAHRIEISESNMSPWEWCKLAINSIVRSKWKNKNVVGVWAKALAASSLLLGMKLDSYLCNVAKKENLFEKTKVELAWYLWKICIFRGKKDRVLFQLYRMATEKLRNDLKKEFKKMIRKIDEKIKKAKKISELFEIRNIITKQLLPEHAENLLKQLEITMEKFKIRIPLRIAKKINLGELGLSERILSTGKFSSDEFSAYIDADELVICASDLSTAERIRDKFSKVLKEMIKNE